MSKTIVVMIDGVSASYFGANRGRLPHLDALARRGLSIGRLRAERLGVSLPGRTSILTGRVAAESGVYGNRLLQGDGFEYASPADVRVPTIAALAREAGLKAAGVGFGMLRPADTDFYRRPWWIGAFIQRGRDAQPTPTPGGWHAALLHEDADDTLAVAAARAGYPDDYTEVDRQFAAMAGDSAVANWTGLLAASGDAPDLIITEFLLPDVIQHRFGYESEPAHWAISYADALIGVMLRRIEDAGRLEDCNIIVLSDHGHAPVERAIRADLVLPDMTLSSEGAVLHVLATSVHDADRAAGALAEFGAVPFENGYLPEEHRDSLLAFLAPDGTSFETGIEGATEPVGDPTNLSSHGLRPGDPGDDRMFVAVGPDVPAGFVASAAANQVAPTIAQLLGISREAFPAPAVF